MISPSTCFKWDSGTDSLNLARHATKHPHTRCRCSWERWESNGLYLALNLIGFNLDANIPFLFPTCQVRVVKFYQSCSPPPPPPPPPPPHPPLPPGSPDPLMRSRTSNASSRSQWALPDLNRELQIAVGTAGPQPRLPDPSGHCRTPTATSRSQWALPDLNGKNVRKDVR